jgi:hypothetical protein
MEDSKIVGLIMKFPWKARNIDLIGHNKEGNPSNTLYEAQKNKATSQP